MCENDVDDDNSHISIVLYSMLSQIVYALHLSSKKR